VAYAASRLGNARDAIAASLRSDATAVLNNFQELSGYIHFPRLYWSRPMHADVGSMFARTPWYTPEHDNRVSPNGTRAVIGFPFKPAAALTGRP
jgi:hypothetical protein